MSFFRAGDLIANISHLSRQISTQRRDSDQLTLSQSRALSLLSANQGVRQVELAELMAITPMSVLKIIDQLVEKALIERRMDPNDRRAFLLFLLPQADSALSEIRAENDRLWREAMGDMAPDKLDHLVQVLHEMSINLGAMKQRQN